MITKDQEIEMINKCLVLRDKADVAEFYGDDKMKKHYLDLSVWLFDQLRLKSQV